MQFEKLSQEEREELASKSPEELRQLAQEQGKELTDEELEAVNGGGDWRPFGKLLPDMKAKCNNCGRTQLYDSDNGAPTRCCYCLQPYDTVE